jgi:hypothetical protein
MAGMDHILSKAFLASSSATAALTFGQLVVPAAGSLLDPNQAVVALAGATGAGAKAGVLLGVCQENLDLAKMATGKAYFGVALQGIVDCIWDGVGTPVAGGAIVPSIQTAGATNNGRVAFSEGTLSTPTFAGLPIVGLCRGSAGDLQSGLPAAAGDLFKVELRIGSYF